MSKKFVSVPKRNIKAYFNAALWGDYDMIVEFLRGTDQFSSQILDREEILRLTLAPKSSWQDAGIPVDTTLHEFQSASPLMISAANGHLRLVSLLLELGADPSLKDRRGRHSLMWAAQTGQMHSIAYLLDWHAESLILTPRTLQRRIVRGDGGASLTADGKEPVWLDSPRSLEKRKPIKRLASPLHSKGSMVNSSLKSPRQRIEEILPPLGSTTSTANTTNTANTTDDVSATAVAAASLPVMLTPIRRRGTTTNKKISHRKNRKNLQTRLKRFINKRDENGWTALLLSIRAGHVFYVHMGMPCTSWGRSNLISSGTRRKSQPLEREILGNSQACVVCQNAAELIAIN